MNEQITQLQRDIQDALARIDSDSLSAQLSELEQHMAEPDFWNDQERAKKITKQHAKIKAKLQPWLEVASKIDEIAELSTMDDAALHTEIKQEYTAIKKTYDQLAFALKLSGKYDDYDALMAIHAGTGGTDAMDWAEMLERMYLRFFEKAGFKTEVIERSAGDEAGIKRVQLAITGPYAYGKLQSEHGVHRLVRLSPFNSDNLRQTSFALVEVTPQIDEPDEVEIDDNDLKIDVYRSGGKGGQSVNTTDSAVRITHEPTGIVVAIQNERSQLQNKQTAMKIVRSKLAQLAAEQHAEKISEVRGPDVQAAWGNQIRNYVLHPYTLVKDTRTKHETTDASAVLDGDIADFVDSYLNWKVGSEA
ncbi:TPA: peptide chain release factor 2 [Candidatus Saccharibacteria bacterium]|nr:peptide chain release factor 2 [Candidatus Saccharibacteria bacterium]HIO87541.1 peptide chain release factor 2 [Candidatus Saccharibacteria bacterium]